MNELPIQSLLNYLNPDEETKKAVIDGLLAISPGYGDYLAAKDAEKAYKEAGTKDSPIANTLSYADLAVAGAGLIPMLGLMSRGTKGLVKGAKSGLLSRMNNQRGVIGGDGKWRPFTEETGTPYIDDSLHNQDYYKTNKGIDSNLEYMSPRSYISKAAHEFGVGYDDIVWGRTQDGRVEKYMEAMKNKDEFPALYIDTSNPNDFGQEGLHRAIAAERLGIDKVPVVVTKKYDPPKPKEDFSEFDRDLLKQLLDDDPQGLLNDLPMDEAARMQRAKDMGFDTDQVYYHGTGDNIEEFSLKKANDLEGRKRNLGYGKGKIYLSGDPYAASNFANDAPRRGKGKEPNVMPLNVRTDKLIDDKDYQAMFEELSNGRPTFDSSFTMKERDALFKKLDTKLAKEGYEGVATFHKNQNGDVVDVGQVAIFDPSNIRSVNAKFDPSKKNSANLLATGLLGGLALPQLLEEDNLLFY